MTKMWHPIRGPVVFAPGAVPMALEKIEHIISHPGMVSGEIAVWLREELSKAAVLFHHARERGESVVSMLDLTRPGPRPRVQPMDTKAARHPNLSFLLAFAFVPAAFLIEQNVKPGAGRVFGAILHLAAVGLVIVPPLSRQVPWPLRILSTLFSLLCWCLLTAMAAYIFGISPL